MKLSISKVSVLVLSLALLAGGTVAEYSGFHRGSRGDFFDGHTLRFFADYLDLTDAQQAQIKQIKASAKPAMKPLHQQECFMTDDYGKKNPPSGQPGSQSDEGQSGQQSGQPWDKEKDKKNPTHSGQEGQRDQQGEGGQRRAS